MVTPVVLAIDDRTPIAAVRVSSGDEIPPALHGLGVEPPRPVVVLVGGAAGLEPADEARVAALFAAIVPVIVEASAAAIDGGTAAGIMRLHGDAHARADAPYPLIGVAAEQTVVLPGRPPPPDAAPLDRHHTHIVLVPGATWGAESPWIAEVATAIAGGAPSATLAVNGGDIVYDDVAHSLAAARPVVVVEGSGRVADQLAAAVHGRTSDERARSLAAAGRIDVVPGLAPETVARTLGARLRVPG